MHHQSTSTWPFSAMQQTGGVLRSLLAILALGLAVIGALGYAWVQHPLTLTKPSVELSIEPGSTPRDVAKAWVGAGVQTSPWLLYQWFKLSGRSKQIKAGGYELVAGSNARDLLNMMVRGDERLATVKLIEGWTFKRFREALAQADGLRPTTTGMSDAALMVQLGKPGASPEGWFFPDTYAYAKGSTDLAVMRRALHAMQKQLDVVWAQRPSDSVLASPQEALILASIVEKETGRESDRPMVAGVFVNRLRVGMPLQTDPTVIYGMGEVYGGSLHKSDLQTDTPYNTYKHTGLPPTPIAMPGKAALLAAVHPADTKALYFVAKGDGSSAFSATLDEHNRAVNQYLRNGRKNP